MALPDYYKLLGVPPSASPDELRAAFRKAILEHHPDRNDSKNSAQEWTIMVKEAYDVLSDPGQRGRYDRQRFQEAHQKSTGERPDSSGPGNGRAATSKKSPPPASARDSRARTAPRPSTGAPSCHRCQAQDETLRFSSFIMVYSIIVFSKTQSEDTGFYCAPCRLRLSLKWAVATFLLGWWGFPFGIIWTLNALYCNLKGGVKSRKDDAALLETVGAELLRTGQVEAAKAALRQSIKLDTNRPADARLRGLALTVPPPKAPRSLRHRLNHLPPSAYAASVSIGTVFAFLVLGADNPSSPSPPAPSAGAVKQVSSPIPTPAAPQPVPHVSSPEPDVRDMSDAQVENAVKDARNRVVSQGLENTPGGKAALAAADAVLKMPQLQNGAILRRKGSSSSKCYLIVHNGNDDPAIVKLVANGSTRYAIYVEAKRSATLWHVATGQYDLKFSIGEDINTRDLKFVGAHRSSRFASPMEFTTTPHGAGVMYSTEEITLHGVPNGNVHPEPVDDADFDEAVSTAPEEQPASAPSSLRPTTITPEDSTEGAGQVWVNLVSRKYFFPGAAYYGRTRQGEYMSETDAKKQGYIPAQGQYRNRKGGTPRGANKGKGYY